VQQNRRVAGLPVEEEEITAEGKKVVILGGGDTSADCQGNANREGAESIQVITHGVKPPEAPDPLEWPDWPFVLHTYPAHEEGGEREWNVAITSFSGADERVERVRAVRAEWTPERTMRRVPGTEFDIEADLVLLAIGFTGPVRDRLLEDLDLGYTDRGAIRSENGFGTKGSGIFVAGDAKLGASLIVWAIAEGRKAARQADLYLMGESRLSP
jgi:glutamate synthase (NADPH/NADH) small chain